METVRLPRVMQDTAIKERCRGKSIGLVPTMGALHDGHMALIRAAREENDIAVVSIFVNPTQFAAGEDFEKYPRDIGGDVEKIRELADVLFLPDVSALYPEGHSTSVDVEGLSGLMCGAFRPGHFRGVATVVLKLFNIIQPTRAYFGLKDYQQTAVVRRLVKDLHLPVDVVLCPTVREADGLAMSSRNAYLAPEERKAAPVLYRALAAGADAIKQGEKNASRVREIMREVLAREPLVKEVDYISAYDPETLQELENVEKSGVLLAGGVKIGAARLIDNLVFNGLQ